VGGSTHTAGEQELGALTEAPAGCRTYRLLDSTIRRQKGLRAMTDVSDATTQPLTGERARGQLLSGLPVTERRLDLAGVSTAVLEGGDGPSVVLLHDPSEYAAKWFRVIPDLVRTHRVVAPDLPGHGTSRVTDGPLDVDRVLAWLGELIDETCPSPPALVGLILGGAIAARFAASHPDRVSRLVLVDALGLQPLQPTPEFGQALTAYLTEPSPGTHDELWRYCAFDIDRLRADLGAHWQPFAAYNVDRATAPDVQAALHQLMEDFAMPAIPAVQLAGITAPTSLIWGRHDLATPLAVAEQASTRYGWPLQVIDDAADDPVIEQPEAFLRSLHVALGRTVTVRPS
jgi:pimeloyl-ACP methyl ester carboxylesterase